VTVTAAQFRTRFPEFDETPDAAVDLALTDASLEVNDDVWSTLTDKGVAYIAAHMIGATNPGAAFARFDEPKIADEPLSITKYGCEFVSMRDALAAGPGVV